MNNISLTGNLCADIELKQTPSGISVCKFNIGVRRPYSSDRSDFIPCTAWRQQAEFLASYGKKGRKVALTGRLETDSYVKDNRKIYTYEVVVENAEFLDSAKKDDASSGSDAAAYVLGAYKSQN